MKTLIYSVLFVFAFGNMNLQAQTSFEDDMTILHKNIFKTCALIKSKTGHDDAKTLESLANLEAQITTLQRKWIVNPPANYAKDPNFGAYFYMLKDVTETLSSKVEKSNYKAATLNCSHFCMTFNMMHAVNGTLDLTDVMFMWYMQVSMTNKMINAHNYKGANINVQKIPALYSKVIALKNKKNDDDFNNQFNHLDTLYQKWIKAVQAKDYKQALEQAAAIDATFPPIFKNSL